MRLPERWQKRPLAWAVFLVGAALVLLDLGRWWLWNHREQRPLYAPRADWSAPYGGGIDLSGFVFRDRNRNGVLDVGDEPMAGIALELRAPDGTTTLASSNLSGFVNFPMSRAKRSATIREPGNYQLRIRVPPDWSVTSGNATQVTTVVSLPGAPADLVAKNPPQPIGLAPHLLLSGRVIVGSAAGRLDPRLSCSAVSPSGQEVRLALGAAGEFRLPVAPGAWRLSASAPGFPRRERLVVVRDAPVQVAAIDLAVHDEDRETEPFTVDFESVTGTPVAKIPSGVGGLGWSGMNAIEILEGKTEGYVNTVTSGHYVGYASSGHPVTISRRGGFDFYGGYLGLASLAGEGDTVRIEAFRGTTSIGAEEFALSALGPVWFDARYRGIDRLHLATRHDWHLVVDDLRFGGLGAPGSTSEAPRVH
jgi:hypothetical protein